MNSKLFRLSACVSVLGAWLLGPALNAQTTKGNVILKATINNLSAGGTEHAAVAWVTGPSGFIKTVWKQGDPTFSATGGDWDHFTTWNTARSGSAAFDGYSSATAADYTAVVSPAPPPPGNNPVYVNWNCKDSSNDFATDGTYNFFIQYAEDINSPKNGPVTAALSWTKGPSQNSPVVTPYSDQGTQSVTSGNNFTNISVEWKPQNVSVAVSPTSVTEDGTPNLVYTFTRSGDTTLAMTMDFTVGGTATLTTDYTQSGAASFSASSGTVNFVAGSATATVTINPVPDITLEPDETVILTVASGAGNYNVGSPSFVNGTIANDEVSATVSVAVAPASVTENGTGNLVYTFSRTGATTAALTANFSVGGSATFSSDYTQSGAADFTSSSGSVTFGINALTATVTLDPVPDNDVEPDETAVLTVSGGLGYNPSGPVATGTITNDDTLYSSWASSLPEEQRGATQIPQNDGITNLMKYACNLDPSAPDVSKLTAGGSETKGLPVQSIVGGKLRMEFLRRKANLNPGITYFVEFSSDMGGTSWSSKNVSSTPAVISIDANWDRVVEDDTVGGTPRFGRLKVTQP